MNPEELNWYTTKEVAAFFGVKEQTVHKWVYFKVFDAHGIRHDKKANVLFFYKPDVDRVWNSLIEAADANKPKQ